MILLCPQISHEPDAKFYSAQLKIMNFFPRLLTLVLLSLVMYSFTVAQEDCPSFITVYADETIICTGTATTLTLQVNDPELGSVDWFWPGGTATGYNPEVIFENESPCRQSIQVEYRLTCLATGEMIAAGAIGMVVFGVPTATVISNTGCEVCISVDCPEYDINWFLDNFLELGAGNCFQADEEQTGEVTFVFGDSQASGDCEYSGLFEPFSCEDVCPAVQEVFISAEHVCSGETVQLIAEVDDPAEAQVSWIWEDGEADGMSTNLLMTNLSGCPETKVVSLELYCQASGERVDSIAYEIVVYEEHQLEVDFGNPEQVSILSDCLEYEYSWTSGEDSGEGNTFNCIRGGLQEILFQVSSPGNEDPCGTSQLEVQLDCPPICAQFEAVQPSSTFACEGDTIDVVASYLQELDTDNTEVIWTVENNSELISSSLHSAQLIMRSPSNCSQTVIVGYQLLCLHTGEELERQDLEIEVFRQPEVSLIEGNCTIELHTECLNVEFFWDDGVAQGIYSFYEAIPGTEGQVTFTLASEGEDGQCAPNQIIADFDCPPVSVQNNAGWPNIAVYPNPASDQFFVKLDNDLNSDLLDIALYNSNGKLISFQVEKTIDGAAVLLPRTLPTGLYFLRFSTEQNTNYSTTRVVVQ